MRTALLYVYLLSDSSAGAGIQADLKTMTMNGVYGMTAITALTAQNTTGDYGNFRSKPRILAAQLDAVFTDIRPDAVKIGMVSSPALIEVIGERLRFYGAGHIVVDPRDGGHQRCTLIRPEAVETLTRTLLPLAQVVTPNIPKRNCWPGAPSTARSHGGRRPHHSGPVRLRRAAQGRAQHQRCQRPAGGRSRRPVVCRQTDCHHHTHGTGCTLSSAIAATCQGLCPADAVQRAKEYLSGRWPPGWTWARQRPHGPRLDPDGTLRRRGALNTT